MTAPGRAALRVRTVDPDGVITGWATGYSEVKLTPRYNAPGSWSLKTVGSAPEVARLYEGCSLLFEVDVDGAYVPIMSGPITQIEEVGDTDHPYGVLTYSGVDDLALLDGYITYPDPTRAVTAQTTAVQWGDIGPAGDGQVRDVIVAAVRQQLLETTSDRRIDRFTVGPNTVGSTTSVSLRSRYESLLAFIQRGAAPYGLGIRVRPEVRRVASRLTVWRIFEVFEAADLSTTVVFSYGRQNLAAHQWRRTVPAYTTAVLGGANEGTARTIVTGTLVAESDLWHRHIEDFLDRRDVDTTPALVSALAEALAEGYLAAAPGLSITPLDLPQQRFGKHYGLGDVVTVEVRTSVTERVREAEITYSPDGPLTVKPLIGPEGALHPRSPRTPRVLALTRAALARTTKR